MNSIFSEMSVSDEAKKEQIKDAVPLWGFCV